MRWGTHQLLAGLLLGGLLTAAGCATAPAGYATRARTYEESAGSALVFDPPVAAYDRPVELAREERRPSAFMGYEETTATFYDVHTYDRQSDDGNQYFERTTYMDKVGVSYR